MQTGIEAATSIPVVVPTRVRARKPATEARVNRVGYIPIRPLAW